MNTNRFTQTDDFKFIPILSVPSVFTNSTVSVQVSGNFLNRLLHRNDVKLKEVINLFFKNHLLHILSFLFLLIQCSSLEQERLAFEKDKLEFEKKKLQFEREKIKSCGCCSPCNTCNGTAEVVVAEKKEKDCIKEVPPTSEDIWALSVEGNWHYAPDKIKNKNICKGDLKETFYKQFANTESYVAEKQVPATKQSSCINNVLFSGKSQLYNLMVDKTAKEESISISKELKAQVLQESIEYNNAEKGRSFYYECKPTDPNGRWDSCKCVLYVSYPEGKQGLS
ncbi:MAG TPA: hypothetical protein PKD50_09905, partial [Leptospiraceae bacterium]|nr:hypothetical protein [Leptospiraceae bacterium]